MSQPTPGVDPNAPPANNPPPPPVNDGNDDDHTNPPDDVGRLKYEATKWRKAYRDKEAELAKLQQASQTDTEKAIAAARAEGADEYAKKWRTAVLTNAALAALAEKGVTATEPALRALDLDDIEIDDNGKVDRTIVETRVSDFLKRYPMFVASGVPGMSVGNISGDGQRRVTSDQVVRPPGPGDDPDKALRYALGR